MITVLLVEDERTLAQIIKDTLEGEGFCIHTAADGEEGLSLFRTLRPDILVADVMMPRMDGFEMVRRIRQTNRHTPILFLTARSATDDVVEGFELGANDYLKKPFGMKELIVRIKALLGRAADYAETKKDDAPPSDITQFEIGEYHFDAITQRLDYRGHIEELSHREAEILKRFCLNPRQVVNTQDILLELWGNDSFFNNRSLHVFITKLRHKLAKDPHIQIVNARGIGYKLIV
ncbi:MAG: response regulator transcription factor [Prevotellaceae bacterium]|jgi:DNA-binding response OmpR family regulator|nr:response regulator transcription factor [Prevotellaceae bacterium]